MNLVNNLQNTTGIVYLSKNITCFKKKYQVTTVRLNQGYYM